ncbi:MAG: membrane protein insertion efficiency factor YidD [Chloroflexota bacterium]
MKALSLALIKLYQETLSRVMPKNCRFTPTCSDYTYQAISKFGLVKGIWLGAKRLARCQPLHPGGYDPVP